MARWMRNRVVSLALTLGNMAFWLCLRVGETEAEKYPFLRFVEQGWVQLAAFFVLGIALVWSLYACKPERKLICAKALLVGEAFVVFQWAYNLLLHRRIYIVGIGKGMLYIAAGVLVGELMRMRLMRHGVEVDEIQINLEPVSTQRSQLMGFAMLYVLLFHTLLMNATYIKPVSYIMNFGFAGVDLFLFLSGMGMVYSLNRDPRILNFYWRRARRIYPEAVPWVGAYSLVGVLLGRCGVVLLVANCIGVGYWLSRNGFAYNWYYSALLLFYFLTPFAYRFLCREKARGWRMALSLFLCLLLMAVLIDILHQDRFLMAFSRLPVFLIGMLVGFWLEERKSLTRSEYRCLLPLGLLFMVLSIVTIPEDFPVRGSLWLCSGASMVLLSLPLARLFGRLRAGGRCSRFLKWVGLNSLPIYLCNILLGRFYDLFVDTSAGSALRRFLCTYAIIAANLLIVFLIRKATAAWKVRAK